MQPQVSSKAEWMRLDVRKGDSAVSACHARTRLRSAGLPGRSLHASLRVLPPSACSVILSHRAMPSCPANILHTTHSDSCSGQQVSKLPCNVM